MHDQYRRAADLLRDADALIVAAGAGMGVDSGLPDFRGDAGFWRAYPALGEAGMAFHEIASPAAFRSDPQLAWGFYGHRLALYRATVPHRGFALLSQWGARMPHGVRVFTSNVDGQFQRAGFDPAGVLECHGSIHYLQCLAPCGDAIWAAEGFVPDVDEARCRLRNAPPRCQHCGAPARPNILMFGDDGWLGGRTAKQARGMDAWLAGVRRPLVIEIGAGTAIASVRRFAHEVVRAHGGRLVRINPREPQVPGARDVGLATGAVAGLEGIVAALRE
jgi:NAD-dependent SIR2 family protein deacetylase